MRLFRVGLAAGVVLHLGLAVSVARSAEGAQDAAGKATIQKLIKELDATDPAVRAKAAGVLGTIGPDAKIALPALKKRLKDPDASVREAAGKAIERVRQEAVSPAIKALIQELESSDKGAKKAAIEALGSLGESAKAALEPLRAAAKDPDAPIRIAALKAIVEIEKAVAAAGKDTPLMPAQVAGSYSGGELGDDEIVGATWKTQASMGIPGVYRFEPQPMAQARAHVRTLLEKSKWTLTAQGEITVAVTLPAGWEAGFNNEPSLKVTGVMKPDKGALEFAGEVRGTAIATHFWLTGTLTRDEAGQLVVEAKVTTIGANVLEAKVRLTLEGK